MIVCLHQRFCFYSNFKSTSVETSFFRVYAVYLHPAERDYDAKLRNSLDMYASLIEKVQFKAISHYIISTRQRKPTSSK